MNTNCQAPKEKVSGIYKITNKTNGKYYIGSSDDIIGTGGRWYEHINNLKTNRHDNSYLQRSWNKYGPSVFEFSILKEIPKSDLLIVEQQYLNEAKKDGKQCYNLSFLAVGGGFSGHKHTEESKQKTSKKLKGRPSPTRGMKLPQISGNLNPNADKKSYQFENTNTGETFDGTRFDLCTKFNLERSGINKMVSGMYKAINGWTIH
jgi:group I intron endonuclease